VASEREQFIALLHRGDIISARIPEALSAAGIAPGLPKWRSFIDNLLLWLGASALAASVLFFVAHNWEAMERSAKFGLVQLLIIGSIGSYVWFREHERIGKVCLFVASILVGVLLALYHQTYQTGADPWGLFATWALLILPWTIVARFAPLWLIFTGLLNLALILYCTNFSPSLGEFIDHEVTLAICMALLNGLALIVWEWRLPHHSWLQDIWSPRILALATGIPATIVGVFSVVNKISSSDIFLLVGWAAFVALLIYYYRQRRADLFMLAWACFAVIVVVPTMLAAQVLEPFGGRGGKYLIMALVIIGMGASCTVWLRKTQKAMFEENSR